MPLFRPALIHFILSLVVPWPFQALDVLTPLGRGASLLVVGPSDSGKTTLALDAVLGQRHTGVKCVYACIGLSTEHLERTAATLEAAGGMGHTVLLAAPEGTSLGKQYAALCMACSIGGAVWWWRRLQWHVGLHVGGG